jgi:hypothetical protein
MRQTIRLHFREDAVEVDASRFWPNVAVTLQGIPRETCADAALKARQIDGWS